MQSPFGHSAEVDIGIADLVEILWGVGMDVVNSCEDTVAYSSRTDSMVHFVWIEFGSPRDMFHFTKLFVAGLVEQYEKITDWDYDFRPENKGANAHQIQLEYKASVRFPVTQLSLVKRAFGVA